MLEFQIYANTKDYGIWDFGAELTSFWQSPLV